MTKKMIIGILILASLALNFGCLERLGENRRDEARSEINKIHYRIKSEEYGLIYEDASPRIRECYSRDGFSEKMQFLSKNLKAEDPELNFQELTSETAKFDAISSRSDLFTEGVYKVGTVDNDFREDIVFRNEDGKLKLFMYRVFNITEKRISEIRSTVIACPDNK